MSGGDRLLAAIRAGTILLDGGMGTRLIAMLGEGRLEGEPSRANRTHPEAVRDIHARDVEAGSDAVLTNTFGANLPRLESLGLRSEFETFNRLGVELAREAAGPKRFVIGTMGPTASADVERSCREQAEVLMEAGADALILETHTADQATRALGFLRASRVPILASLWIWPEDAVSSARRLQDAGASAIGTNCGRGLDDVLAATEAICGAVALPLIAKPSAGVPGNSVSPERFRLAAPRFVELGVRLLGGCCGTTEAHIAALRSVLP